jgi:hypothetical protein
LFYTVAQLQENQMSNRNKRDAKRYRFIKKLTDVETSSMYSYFWIRINKEYRDSLFSKSTKVKNYRTLNGAVDRMMRDSR